ISRTTCSASDEGKPRAVSARATNASRSPAGNRRSVDGFSGRVILSFFVTSLVKSSHHKEHEAHEVRIIRRIKTAKNALLLLRRYRTDEITIGEVSDCFSGLRECSDHLGAPVDPQDRESCCSDIYKPMRLIRGDKRCIERVQAVALSINLRFGLPFENRHLLIAVMRMQRNLRAGWKAGQSCRHGFGPDLFGDERYRLNPIAAVDHRQRIDFQYVSLCHGEYLLSESLAL